MGEWTATILDQFENLPRLSVFDPRSQTETLTKENMGATGWVGSCREVYTTTAEKTFSGSEASMVYTLSKPMSHILLPCYPKVMVYTTTFCAL